MSTSVEKSQPVGPQIPAELEALYKEKYNEVHINLSNWIQAPPEKLPEIKLSLNTNKNGEVIRVKYLTAKEAEIAVIFDDKAKIFKIETTPGGNVVSSEKVLEKQPDNCNCNVM